MLYDSLVVILTPGDTFFTLVKIVDINLAVSFLGYSPDLLLVTIVPPLGPIPLVTGLLILPPGKEDPLSRAIRGYAGSNIPRSGPNLAPILKCRVLSKSAAIY